jgi:hypothetical protein
MEVSGQLQAPIKMDYVIKICCQLDLTGSALHEALNFDIMLLISELLPVSYFIVSYGGTTVNNDLDLERM